jgi:hypothetical protein
MVRMRYDTLAHEVRRLIATSTTDPLVQYVKQQVGESYTRGYWDGYRQWQRVTMRALLWRSLRRGLWRLVRRLR